MSENKSSPQPGKTPESLQQLLADLRRMTTSQENKFSDALGGDQMLSLILDEVANGVDIAKRYPRFYQRLLEEPRLRQAFLDNLDAMDEEGENIAWEIRPVALPDFLAQTTSLLPPSGSGNSWAVMWRRNAMQLQSLFSPSELAFRYDPALSEDFWLILIQEEVNIGEAVYRIVLECKLSSMAENGLLSPSISIVATIGENLGSWSFPLNAILQWGEYNEELQVQEAKRISFPDIPFSAFTEGDGMTIRSDLKLTLQSLP